MQLFMYDCDIAKTILLFANFFFHFFCVCIWHMVIRSFRLSLRMHFNGIQFDFSFAQQIHLIGTFIAFLLQTHYKL